MTAEHFYNLLQNERTDPKAKQELHRFVLANIKRCLIVKYGYVLGTDELADAAHTVFKSFLTYKPTKFVFFPYSYISRIVYNNIYTKNDDPEPLPLTADIPYEQTFEELDKADMLSVLSKCLGKRDAMVVYYYVIEKMKAAEVAAKLGLTADNVRQIYKRSMPKLKEYLDNVTK